MSERERAAPGRQPDAASRKGADPERQRQGVSGEREGVAREDAGLVGQRGELLHELAETARFLGSLSKIGVPWPAPGAAAAESAPAAAGAPGAEVFAVSGGASAKGVGTDAVSALAAASADGARDGGAASGEAGLRAIREEMGDCTRCRLSQGRKTIVFGQGNPNAELMFVGEAPGAEEDQQGLAFVGRAGQLLTDIIEKGLKMKRSEVWIGNAIKCRPPQNRNPEPDEIIACQPFLEAQIRAIRPRVLVGLGKFGAHWLLKTAVPITRLRGKVGEYEGIPVMPTYHPAYLLRNPSAKKDLWEDMKVVLQILGRPVPR